MHKFVSWKPLSFLAVCLSLSLSAAAEPFKLYINKHDSAQNVVLLENELSATVKHTSEGMEITLQGVEISMRCRGNSSSTDGCTIAIEPGTTTTTTTSGGSTDTSGGSSGSGTTTTSTSGSDDCTDGTSTWASSGCDDSTTSTSSGDSGSTTSSSGGGSTTTTTTTSGGSTAGCGSGVVCSTRDFGPDTNVQQQSYTFRSSIYAFPMSAPNRAVTSSVTWATTASTPANKDGSSLRAWLSKEAGGPPVGSDPDCGEGRQTIDQFYYSYGRGSCPLDASTKYWFNFAYCPGNPKTDLRCLNSPSPAQELRLYIVP